MTPDPEVREVRKLPRYYMKAYSGHMVEIVGNEIPRNPFGSKRTQYYERHEADALIKQLTRDHADAISALQAELAQTEQACVEYHAAIAKLTSELDAARIEREGFKTDALRYRWLRDRWFIAGEAFPDELHEGAPSAVHFDEAIDSQLSTTAPRDSARDSAVNWGREAE